MDYKKAGLHSDALAAEQYNNEQIKKASEKMEAITLKELGKFSAFKEIFEGVPLEEQDFSYANIKGDIITNPYFLEGRNFGFVLIKNGFSNANYLKYKQETESKKHRS